MSQEQTQRPVTYGDVFESVHGELASEVITDEDAALLQITEILSFDQTQTGGPASAMQAATDKNVETGAVDPAAHSDAAEHGFGGRDTNVDGEVHQQQFVGEHRVADQTTQITYDPTFPESAAAEGITIGQVLEEVAVSNPDKVVDENTAEAVLSAETLATGIPMSLAGGIGVSAYSAARKNTQGEQIKLSEVLNDATKKMLLDKVVTQEDVEEVKDVEGSEGVLAPSLQGAVDSNTAANRYLEPQYSDFKPPAGLLKPDEGRSKPT